MSNIFTEDHVVLVLLSLGCPRIHVHIVGVRATVECQASIE